MARKLSSSLSRASLVTIAILSIAAVGRAQIHVINIPFGAGHYWGTNGRDMITARNFGSPQVIHDGGGATDGDGQKDTLDTLDGDNFDTMHGGPEDTFVGDPGDVVAIHKPHSATIWWLGTFAEYCRAKKLVNNIREWVKFKWHEWLADGGSTSPSQFWPWALPWASDQLAAVQPTDDAFDLAEYFPLSWTDFDDGEEVPWSPDDFFEWFGSDPDDPAPDCDMTISIDEYNALVDDVQAILADLESEEFPD